MLNYNLLLNLIEKFHNFLIPFFEYIRYWRMTYGMPLLKNYPFLIYKVWEEKKRKNKNGKFKELFTRVINFIPLIK